MFLKRNYAQINEDKLCDETFLHEIIINKTKTMM